eukprot:1383766-Amorphochlora_amoeboformis.AAC.1
MHPHPFNSITSFSAREKPRSIHSFSARGRPHGLSLNAGDSREIFHQNGPKKTLSLISRLRNAQAKLWEIA